MRRTNNPTIPRTADGLRFQGIALIGARKFGYDIEGDIDTMSDRSRGVGGRGSHAW